MTCKIHANLPNHDKLLESLCNIFEEGATDICEACIIDKLAELPASDPISQKARLVIIRLNEMNDAIDRFESTFDDLSKSVVGKPKKTYKILHTDDTPESLKSAIGSLEMDGSEDQENNRVKSEPVQIKVKEVCIAPDPRDDDNLPF